jgi:hypothetical protein
MIDPEPGELYVARVGSTRRFPVQRFEVRARLGPPASALLDQLDPVAVGIAHEAEP